MITSLNNARIKEINLLKQSKYRKETKTFIVEGEHLVQEAKLQGILIEAYTTVDYLEGELISEPVMKKLCNTNSSVNQIGICKMIEKSAIGSKVLILDQVQDPGNMGALMRSAVAFNFETIFLADGCVDIYNDKVIRSSQGAIFKLNFINGDPVVFIKQLQETHLVYGTDVIKGIAVSECDKPANLAFILGNEGSGVTDKVKAIVKKNIYLKMNNTESLNVSVAGGIIMYELGK